MRDSKPAGLQPFDWVGREIKVSKRMPFLLLVCALVLGALGPALLPARLLQPGVTAASPHETRLMRYPDISRDQVVFVYAGDLWILPRAGGPARRLTSQKSSLLLSGDHLGP